VTFYLGKRKVAEEWAKLSILQFSKNSQIAANSMVITLKNK